MQPDHRCTNLRRPCAGERSIYELLRDGDERHPVRIELFDHFGEIGQRPRQPVDLVDDHDVDEAVANILEQTLQCGPLHGTAR